MCDRFPLKSVENKINEAKTSDTVAKDIDMTSKDATEVGKEYLEDESVESAAPVVVGKLDDEYVEVVETKDDTVVADNEASEIEISADDNLVPEPLSATLGRKTEATTQASITYTPDMTVIGNQDTKDEWDTGS